MTQTTQLVITANAGQAVAEMKRAEEAMRAVGAATVGADRKLRDAQGRFVAMGGAARKAGDDAKQAAQDFHHMAGSLGGGGVGGRGMNVGQAALEASRAMEDLQYGIGGVVNNIPSLVMAIGGGAGLTAVISTAAVGAAQLYKNWDSVKAAFGSTDLDVKAAKGAIKDLAAEFDTNLNKHLEEGRATLADLKAELRDFGLSARDKSLEQQRRDIEDMEKRLANLQETRRFRQAAANKAESERNKDAFAEAQAILVEGDRRAQALEQALKKARSTYLESAKTAAELRQRELAREEAEEQRRRREAAQRREDAKQHREQRREEDRTVVESGSDRISTGWEERDQLAREKANEAAINAQLARDERIAANEEMFRNMAYEAERAQAERLEALWSDYAGTFTDIGGQMYAASVRAAGDYFDAIITGQEFAAEKIGIGLMRTAGDSLVSSGIKLSGEAVVSAFTPGLQPLAAAQAGAAAGLIAGGIALGAGATGIEHVMAGGTIGKALPERDTRSATDPGASPGRSTGGSGGPMIINVSYGAGGPLPEDIGREIAKAVGGTNRRRGGR